MLLTGSHRVRFVRLATRRGERGCDARTGATEMTYRGRVVAEPPRPIPGQHAAIEHAWVHRRWPYCPTAAAVGTLEVHVGDATRKGKSVCESGL